ncbi:hypothetical protein IWQ62_003901 [Dispira parvispora]|uniref:Amino acid transporter n=1 Tax=Dispira parvispora TaxID=1520584 RepID=A0A9W8ANH7_9FUNG|nr:hypothetical protein IWQ62_003901 [Dispira parvispora]
MAEDKFGTKKTYSLVAQPDDPHSQGQTFVHPDELGQVRLSDEISKDGNDDEVPLPRTMGVLSASALVCGLMIGSGVFSTPGVVLSMSGSASMALLYWFLAALISLSGALSYIELGCLLPESGGEQIYLDYCIRKPRQLFGFLFSFCTIVCMRPGSIATNAIVFGKYLIYAVYGSTKLIEDAAKLSTIEWQQRGLAMLCLVAVTIISMVSNKWSVRALDILTWIKVLVLVVFSVTGLVILAGWTSIPRSDLWSRGFSGTSTDLHQHTSAIFNAFWAYDGWHNLNFCMGEVKNPQRNLPLAAAGGIAITTVLYMLTNVAFFTVVTMEDVVAGEEVLAGTWGTKVFGLAFGRIIVPTLIAISCAGSITAMVFGVSRLIVAAAQKNYLPFSFLWVRISPRWGTPINALVLNFVLVSLYILAPPPGKIFQFLVDFISYPSRLFYGLTVVGMVMLRFREPLLERTFKVWMIFPYLYILVSLVLAVFPFIPPVDTLSSPYGYPYFVAPLLGISYSCVGIPFWYYLVRRPQRLAAAKVNEPLVPRVE